MTANDPEAKPAKLYCDTRDGDGVPMDIWHHRRLCWTIGALTADAANALMTEVLPLAERVVAGYSPKWNGSNTVGELDDDAQDADASDLCAESLVAGDEDWASNVE